MRLAVTGHRPNKLGGYGEEAQRLLKQFAKTQIEKLQPTDVLTGMALGWDQACAQACIELGIRFVACIPCRSQEQLWPKQSQEIYVYFLRHDLCTVYRVSEEEYRAELMQRRNEYMVNNCDKLLALWDGTKGGTASCVRYARSKNIEIINCHGDFLKIFSRTP